MNDLAIVPIVGDKVLVNIIGNKYEFYRTAYDDDDDCYKALFDFCEFKNIIVRDVHEYPKFEYDGMVMFVKCELDKSGIDKDNEFKNFILLDREEVFDALADETITGLLDYLLFEKLYTTYLK